MNMIQVYQEKISNFTVNRDHINKKLNQKD